MWFCTETVKIFHTELNSNKEATKITDFNAFILFLFEQKYSQFTHFYYVKFLARKFGRVIFFVDKYQVCPDLQMIPPLAPAPSPFFFITPILNNNKIRGNTQHIPWSRRNINGPTCYHLVTAWTALGHHLEKLGHNLETSLRQIWSNFRITLGHIWDIFGTTLRQVLDNSLNPL